MAIGMLQEVRRPGPRLAIVVGLVVGVLLAGLAATVSLAELRTVSEELERHTAAAEREGFASRQLDRVDDLTAEAEAGLFEWLVDPSDTVAARDSLQARDALLREVRRAAAVLQRDAPAAADPLLQAVRAVDVELAAVRSEITGADGAATAERRMAEHFIPVLSQLQDALDRVRADLRSARRARLAALDARIVRSRLATAASAVLLVTGLVVVWLWTLHAITRHRREIDAHVERLQQANEELDAFAGRVAHELRNVLSPVSLSAQVMASTPAGRESRVGLQRIERVIRRSDAVVRDLLEFARAGRISEGETNAGALAREIVGELEDSATQRRVQLVTSIDDVTVSCAPGLLHTLVANLVDNAIKFTADQGAGRVHVLVARVADGCRIVVEDDGPGIPSDALPHVTEPFYRASDAGAPGTGIGLATVKRIAAAHGGTMRIQSEPGRGTRVEVTLPLATPSPARHAGDVA